MSLDPSVHHRRDSRGERTVVATVRADGPLVVAARPDGASWVTSATRLGNDVTSGRGFATRGEAWSEAWRIAQALGPSFLVLHGKGDSVVGVWYVDGEGRSSAVAHQQLV